MTEEKIKDTPSQEKELSWAKVEEYLNEGTKSGGAMALIETEKIFSAILNKLNFPGKNTDVKVKSIQKIFSNYPKLKLAREIHHKILNESGAEISPEEAKEVLQSYYQAIRDLTESQKKPLGFFGRLWLRIRGAFPNPKIALRNLGVGLLVFFFIVFALDSTSTGRALVRGVTSVSHFIFSWVLFTVLLVIGVGIIVVGSLFFFESRKKKKAKIKVEED